MPNPSHIELGYSHPDVQLSEPVEKRAQEIGLGKLTQDQVELRFVSLKKQLKNGLKGSGTPKLDVIRTGIPIVTADAWSNASKKPIFVQEIGGENQKLSIAQIQEDGTIKVSKPLHHQTHARNERQITFDQFIGRIAEPIVAHSKELDANTPIDVGISLGLPHKNRKTLHGAEAILDTPDGILPKETLITDWKTLPSKEKKIVASIRKKVKALSKGSVAVNIGVVMNDTPGVAEDAGAARKARSEGFVVLRASAIGGTGTNGAIDVEANKTKKGGLVNTEIGHAAWPDDPVSNVMRQRLVAQSLLPAERKDKAELEHETGSYIARRIAAAVVLLGSDVFSNPESLATQLEKEAVTNPGLVSDLATRKVALADTETNKTLQGLAHAALDRAKQVYGIFSATLADTQHIENTSGSRHALLTEGSALLKATKGGADTLKTGVELVTAELGQPVTLYEASGMAGVAGVTMSWEALTKKVA